MLNALGENAWFAYALLASAGVIGAVGDALLNYWVRTHRDLWLAVSSALWVTAAISFAWLLKTEHFTFATAVVLGLLTHLTLAVVLDRCCFGGSFTSWQWVGFVFAIAAVVLLNSTGTRPHAKPRSEVRADAVGVP